MAESRPCCAGPVTVTAIDTFCNEAYDNTNFMCRDPAILAANRNLIFDECSRKLLWISRAGTYLKHKEMYYFLNYAEDKSGQFIYYEDDVQRMILVKERQKEKLDKEYEGFRIPGQKWEVEHYKWKF